MRPEPVPRSAPSTYSLFVWPEERRTALSARTAPLNVDLVSLIEERHTDRDFYVPLSAASLGEFLWLTCRSRSSRPSAFGFDQESRPHPSAGALHPIHVLVAAHSACWSRYDPINHALVELPGSQEAASTARLAASHLLEVGEGTLVALVSEPGKTKAKYLNHESLVWRDAGVVLGYMSVVSEALKLAFCPLGLTGDPGINSLFGLHSGLQGAGLAVLGG